MKLRSVTRQEKLAASCHSPISDLPEPLLIRILRNVPLPNRLGNAALVCQSWAAAAAAATPHAVLQEKRVTPQRLQSLQAFLARQHASSDTKQIKVPTHNDNVMYSLQLPRTGLVKLRGLQLSKCDVSFNSGDSGNSSAQPGDVAAAVLPELRVLSLNTCTLPLDALSRVECPRLTSLSLFDTPGMTPSDVPSDQLDTALSALLQRLPAGLLQLRLGHSYVSDAALVHLSAMQQLQHVTIQCPKVTPGAVLAHLPTSITALGLKNGGARLLEQDLPAAGLPRLQSFKASCISIQPALLSKLTALEQLRCARCMLMTHSNTAFRASLAEMQTAATQLLAALAQLTRLRKLDLHNTNLTPIVGGHDATSLARFSALTASSQLDSLKVVYRSRTHPLTQPVPKGAVALMFPPGRRLAALTELVLDAAHPDLVMDLQEEDQDWGWDDPFVASYCVEGAELNSIVAACPNLQRLTLNSVVNRCRELAMVQLLRDAKDQLTGLTFLCLGGPCLTDAQGPLLGSIARLRELECRNAPNLCPDGLEHLTNLQQLTKLVVQGAGLRRSIYFRLKSKTRPPNVWEQLKHKLPELRMQHSRLRWQIDFEEASSDDDFDTDDFMEWFGAA